jgi:hypothetical protein
MRVNLPETPELLDLLHTLDNFTTSSTLIGRCFGSDDPETDLYVWLKIELWLHVSCWLKTEFIKIYETYG